MDDPTPSPQETSDQVARNYFKIGSDPAARQAAVWQWLIATLQCAVLVPSTFFLRYGDVDDLAWGVTLFFVCFCLLVAVGIYFRPRTDFHTKVRPRGDWKDRIGAFWLVSCAFEPLFGWMITSAIPITAADWRWLYGARAILAIGVPLITALPLTRYLSGKAMLVALPILVLITLLPICSAANVARDLWDGPVARHLTSSDPPQLYLRHTEQFLSHSS